MSMSAGPGGSGSRDTAGETLQRAAEERSEPRLADLLAASLVVPIRSSSGEAPDPERVPIEGLRHATDEQGRFLAAFTSNDSFDEFGPPGSDRIVLPARRLFTLAQEAGERVLIDPGAPARLEVGVDLLSYLAAGIDPNHPDALRARTPIGADAALTPPDEVPEPFASDLRRVLGELDRVERAWLLRRGSSWTAGIQLDSDAELADFDQVRNRLHALATERLGSRRELAVTDLRSSALRERYDATSAPFYVRKDRQRRGFRRLIGR